MRLRRSVGKRIFALIFVTALILSAVVARGYWGLLVDTRAEDHWIRMSGILLNEISDLNTMKLREEKKYERAFRFALLRDHAGEQFREQGQRLRQELADQALQVEQSLDLLIAQLDDQSREVPDDDVNQVFMRLRDELRTYRAHRIEHWEISRSVLDLLFSGKTELALTREARREEIEERVSQLSALITRTTASFEKVRVALQTRRTNAMIQMLFFALSGMAFTLTFGLALRRKVIIPLRRAARLAQQVAAGRRDLDFPIEGQDDEPAQLMRAMASMVQAVNDKESLLDRQNAYVESILQATPIPLIAVRSDGRIEFVNGTFLKTYGIPGDPTGKVIYGLNDAEWDIRDLRACVAAAFADRDTPIADREIEARIGGETRWLLLNSRMIRLPTGDSRAVALLSVTDVTDRKRIMIDLASARAAAIEASKAKTLFLSNMSHEIRTPLNAIIGMADLLAETPLDADQKRYVEIFEQAGQTLLSTVNDILDIAKIERGELHLETAEFDLPDCVESVCELFGFKAHEKGLELNLSVDPTLPSRVAGDSARLQQIFTNLIGNAVKFTQRGEIYAEIQDAGRTPDGRLLIHFQVTDSGIGIPREQHDRIFRAFKQGNASTSRIYGGTGLGLAICKSIVEKMGGEIGFHSEPGKGSTFHFRVPLTIAEPGRTAGDARVDLSGKRVLILEDNRASRLCLGSALSDWGASVVEAPDPGSALESLSAHGPFDVLFIDGGFAEKDLIHAVRSSASPELRVLLLLPNHKAESALQVRTLGADACVLKPFRRKDLARVMETAMNPESARARAPVEAPIPAPADQAGDPVSRILLVEDSVDNQTVVLAYLKGLPYEVDVAADGAAAYEMAISRHYDTILMDIEIPIRDGIETTQEIRTWEAASGRPKTPIIALTAHAFQSEKDKCLRLGFDDYLTKPLRKKTLVDCLRHFVSSKRFRETAIAAPAQSASESAAQPALADQVDPSIRHLVPKYVSNRRKEVSELEAAALRGDFEFIERLGHKLKGNAETFGFKHLGRIGRDLENAARDREQQRIGSLLQDMKDYLDKVG